MQRLTGSWPTRAARALLSRWAGVVLALAATGSDAWAEEWRWTTLSPQEGLPARSVTALAVGRAGDLWIGTGAGLARYDGLHFAVLNPASAPALTSNRIRAVLESRDGALWVGTHDRGVLRIAGERVTSFHDAPEAPRGPIRALLEGADGTVWCLGDQVTRFDGERFRAVSIGVDRRARSIHPTGDGALWVSTSDGLLRVADTTVERFEVEFAPTHVGLTSDGTPWYSGSGRVAVFDGRRFRAVDVDGALPEQVRSSWVDAEGRLWLGGVSGLFHCRAEREPDSGWPDGRPAWRSERVGTMTQVSAIVSDREGNVWVGTIAGGLVRGHVEPYETLAFTHPTFHVAHDRADDGRDRWIAAGQGITRWRDGRWEAAPELLVADRLASITGGHDGGLWLGTDGAVLRFDGTDVVRYPHALGRTATLFEDAQERVWILASEGLGKLEEGAVDPVAWPTDLPVDGVFGETRDGAIWLGTWGRLTRLTGERRTIELPDVEVRSIQQDERGDLWVATYGGGLLRVRDGDVRPVSTAGGLPCRALGKIVLDPNGERLWINSNRGVIVVSLAALDRHLDGGAGQLAAHCLSSGEGLGRSGGVAGDGRIWFPTFDGLILIDPTAPTNPLPPPLPRIEAVTVDGRTLLPMHFGQDGLDVPPGPRELTFRFGAPAFRRPEATSFRYRLEGHDPDWVDAGATRVVRYSDVAPGDYRFLVTASTAGGPWNPSPAAARLRLAPAFHETPGFVALLAVAVLAGIAGVHMLRTRVLRGHNQALRREVEKRQRVEASLHVALSSAELGTWHYDAATGIVTRDANLERMLGGPVVGGDVVDRVHPEDTPFRAADFERLSPGEDPLVREYRVVRPDGSIRWLRDRGRASFRDDGSLDHVTGATVDITDRKRVEETRVAYEEHLRHRQKMEAIGQLAAGVAHEFNNLLVVIIGNAELLLEGRTELNAGERRSLEDVRRCGQRAAALTRKLLTFGQKSRSHVAVFDVNELVRESEEMLRRMLGDDMTLRVEPAPEPVRVEADRDALAQVLLNLVLNARDAVAADGTIKVSTARRFVDAEDVERNPDLLVGAHVELTVADDGCGMQDDVAERAFEPFFTTKPPGQGTGLGLSTAFTDVAQAGGHITLESSPGLGTRVRVLLPRVEGAGTVARAESLPTGTETILILDDQEGVRHTLAATLRRAGYTVLQAATLDEAVEHVSATRRVHLLLTDVVMPGASGPVAAGRIRSVEPGLRIVYMSGFASEQALPAELVQGDVSFLQKPIARDQLLRSVRAMLDRPASKQDAAPLEHRR